MKTTKNLVFLSALLTLFACSGQDGPVEFSVSIEDIPMTDPAASPRLSSGPDGRLVMSWLQAAGDAAALRYSTYADGQWSTATTVSTSQNMFVNWADLPSVVPLGGEHLAAHWLVMSGAHSYAYDIVVSESHDNGATWSPATTPHNDGTATEHGFVSIFPSEGGAGLLWLDGRKMINDATDDPVASGMTLRSNDQVVDELVCDCCQTDVAIARSGPVAVYRNRSVDEIRDIYVTRQIDGEWQPGMPVAIDNWKIDGCPVNGPSISTAGDQVAVAWFTAAEEPLVNVAMSTDSAASFSAPIEIVRRTTLGRVAVALLDDGDVAVSWLETTDPSSSEVKVRKVLGDGSLGPVRTIASTASKMAVPQMLRHGSELVFAWTESKQDDAYIASASVAISAL